MSTSPSAAPARNSTSATCRSGSGRAAVAPATKDQATLEHLSQLLREETHLSSWYKSELDATAAKLAAANLQWEKEREQLVAQLALSRDEAGRARKQADAANGDLDGVCKHVVEIERRIDDIKSLLCLVQVADAV